MQSNNKINTVISTKTVSQEHVAELVTASGATFGVTASQLSRFETVSQQLQTKKTQRLFLSECGEMATISDSSLALALECCSLADVQGAKNACAHGGSISQLLVVQETKKVMDFAVAVRLLGCSFAFGISAEMFKTRIAGCKTSEELNLALGFAFDFKLDAFHRVVKQTKWYLRAKVDGFCEWIHNLWISIKETVKTKVKHAWRELKAAIKHTAITVQTTVTGALHALFCEIIPSLHAEVVARLSMTCSWIREVCLPTMYGVLIVRPGLWLQAKHCEFKKQLNKFFEWVELHKFVLKIDISAKVDLSVSRKRTTKEDQCLEVVKAADLTFVQVHTHRHQFTALYKCIFNGTAILPHWSQSIAALNLKSVQVKQTVDISGMGLRAASVPSGFSATSVQTTVDTLWVDFRELTNTTTSSLFLYQGVKTLRVGVEFTRNELVSQKSGIYLVTSPATKNCPPELAEIRRELAGRIESTQLLAKSTVTEVRYEFIEKETGRVVLTMADSLSRGF